MTRRVYLLVLAALLAGGGASRAQSGPAADVASATDAWVAAFNARDLEGLLGLYDPDAVFWGTSSRTLRDTPADVREYFRGLPTSQIRVELGESRVRVFADMAVNTGYYTFTDARTGTPVVRPSRFSFTYRMRGGRWLIVDHHSSAVPS